MAMRFPKGVILPFVVVALAWSEAVVLAQGSLVNGENHSGSIGVLGELDEWTFTAAQGDAISISIGEVFTSEVDPGFNPWIRLRDPNGTQLGSIQAALATRLDLTAPLSGTYTVVVASFTVATGNYRLTLAHTPGDFVVPVGDEGGPMTNGANHPGVIHLGDLDQWTFSAAQGDRISVSIGEVFPGETDPGFNPWIRLRGPNGTELGSIQAALATRLDVTAPLSGTYTVVVASFTVAPTGNYLLTLAKSPGAFVVPDGDEGGPMTNGANHPGVIHLGDLDQWTFDAAQGDAISVSIGEVFPGETDPGFNPWIRLRGPDGTELGSIQAALATHIDITAPLTGSYTVVVASFTVAPTGNYRLTLAKTPGAFVVPEGDEGGPMSNAVAHPGVVHLGDLDQWTFTAAQGASLTISIGEVIPGETDPGFNPWIRLRGPNGAQLGSIQAALATQINVNAPLTGLYTVVVASFTVNSDPGLYQLTVLGVIPPPPPPTTVNDAFATNIGTALVIPPPGVLANDNSNGGGPLSAQLVTNVGNGVLAFDASGSFTYTPNAGFSGADSFTYRAANAGGPGNLATVTITVAEPTTAMPPMGLYAASVGGNVVTLRWTRPSAGLPPTGYVLEGGVTPGQVLASVPTGSAYPIFTFTAPSGAFFVRIHTLSGANRSGASNEIRIFVNVPAAPSAPADLLGLVNGSSLSLAWRNTFGGGAPTSLVLNVSGSIVASIPLGLTETFSFAGVPPGTYTFALRAVNAAGMSAPSAPVTLTFPFPCSGPPLTPSGFLAYRIGNTISVIWDPATTGPAPTLFRLNVTGSFVVSVPTPSRSLSGGVGPGTYNLSVVALNPCGPSAPTELQTVIVP
jgi:Bacterial Ig domain